MGLSEHEPQVLIVISTLGLLFKMVITIAEIYFYQQLINVLYLNYCMELIEFK